MSQTLTLLTTLALVGVLHAQYPDGLPKCKYGNSDCIASAITEVGKGNGGGNNELFLIPFDPLDIRKLEIIQDPSSPVNIQLRFKDVKLMGASTGTAYKVIGFEEDPSKSQFQFNVKIPKLTLAGPYDIKGRVLILPITGNGNSKLQFDNVDARIKFITKVVEKNGEKYLDIQKIKLDFTTTRLHIQLDNLFNGDRTLGDNMNKFLNENWNDIFNELKPAVNSAIGEILKGVIGQVFANIPYAELFEN